MSDTPSRDRISQAAILVRNAGFPDVCKWMLAKDQRAAKGTRKGKRVVLLAHVKGKSGKFFIDSDFLAQSEQTKD